MQQLSEQEIQRRETLQKLIDKGINPYPAETWEMTFSSKEIIEKFEANAEDESLKEISFAGRLMSKRIMGKAAFAVLQDSVGKIQFYVKGEEICPTEDKSLYEEVFKHWFDLGDIIGIKGYVFRTKTGEISIHCKEIKLLSKALKV